MLWSPPCCHFGRCLGSKGPFFTLLLGIEVQTLPKSQLGGLFCIVCVQCDEKGLVLGIHFVNWRAQLEQKNSKFFDIFLKNLLKSS